MNKIKKEIKNIRALIKSSREIEFPRIIYPCDDIEKILDYIDKLEIENKELESRIRKAIEIINIQGTYRLETADYLYSALRGEDHEKDVRTRKN